MNKVKISKDGDEHQDEVSTKIGVEKSGLKNQGWKIRVEKLGMTKDKISKDVDEHQDEVSTSSPNSGLKNQDWKIRVEKFASLLSDGFTVMAVMNPSEKKFEKRTSLRFTIQFWTILAKGHST